MHSGWGGAGRGGVEWGGGGSYVKVSCKSGDDNQIVGMLGKSS